MASFETFVAWRYLMARERRVSRLALVVFFIGLSLGLASLALREALLSSRNPLELGLEATVAWSYATTLAGYVAFALAGLAVFFGVLRLFFTFFTVVPVGGVWIGTGALVCVLSVMSGFESDLRHKILGSNAHVQITREDGDFVEWREVKAMVDRIDGVRGSTPFASSEVVIAANNNGMNVIIKGIDPSTIGTVTELVQNLEDRSALQRLAPLVQDGPSAPPPSPGGASVPALDPGPDDLLEGGEPIDFSDATSSEGAPTPPPPPPTGGSGAGARRGDDGYGGDAAAVVDFDRDAAADPAPRDLQVSEDEPVDFSGQAAPPAVTREGDLHVIDIPMSDTPRGSRRTLSLPGIIVGRELVKQTHMYTGQEVRVVSPLSDPANPDATGTPIPFNRDYRVAGIFYTGMYEYDLKQVYVSLDSFQEFLDRGDAVDGIEVRVQNPDDAGRYVRKIAAAVGPAYRVVDWTELNRSLFSALKLEKISMFIVLGIVILVASFSIVGNLIMVVFEKGREIALLKTLGATNWGVMWLFVLRGLMIGVIGTVLGVGMGLSSCIAAKRFGIPLNPDVYYIDRLPIHIDANSVVLIAFAGVAISGLAALYPALLAIRIRPATGLRH
jgi:lipoprotein-releasing system permease protein